MKFPFLITNVIIAVCFVLDQLTKYWSKEVLVEHPISLGFLTFTYATNTGAAFSLFSNNNWGLLAVTLIVGSIVGFLYYNTKEHQPVRLWYALIIAGALGNGLDRLLYGHVIDFIDVGFWPIFNIADSALSVAIVGLLWTELRSR